MVLMQPTGITKLQIWAGSVCTVARKRRRNMYRSERKSPSVVTCAFKTIKLCITSDKSFPFISFVTFAFRNSIIVTWKNSVAICI